MQLLLSLNPAAKTLIIDYSLIQNNMGIHSLDSTRKPKNPDKTHYMQSSGLYYGLSSVIGLLLLF